MTIFYWTALLLASIKLTRDLDAFTKGSLRRDLLVFAVLILLAVLLTLLIGAEPFVVRVKEATG